MRTTVRLNDQLLERARRRAASTGTTLTALIEQGLTLVLSGPVEATPRKRVKLPVSKATGGTLPGVDLTSSAALLDAMEGAT